jgi:hypothetical protein
MSRPKLKLLTKNEMIASGMMYNYELIMNEYLDSMPFNKKERSEVKLALQVKINSAFDQVISGRNKKALKKLDKRFKELKKITEQNNARNHKIEDITEDKYINDLSDLMFHRQ